jgi:hypothetical protein
MAPRWFQVSQQYASLFICKPPYGAIHSGDMIYEPTGHETWYGGNWISGWHLASDAFLECCNFDRKRQVLLPMFIIITPGKYARIAAFEIAL